MQLIINPFYNLVRYKERKNYMVIFLTSSFFQNEPINENSLKPLSKANGFIEQLRKYWTENARFLIFASDPSDEELAKNITVETEYAFSVSGLNTYS